MAKLSSDIAKQAARTKKLLETRLPDKIIQLAEQLVDGSFRKEKYDDGQSSKWKPRSNDPDAGAKRVDRRALLVKTGNLVGSIEAKRRGSLIVIETPVPYAPVHNEGQQAGRGKGFQMPKRQFMPIQGEPFPKEKQIEDWLDKQLDAIFK